MQFKQFSNKQLMALSWWYPKGKYSKKDAIICDGAVRSGKTLCLSLSFILWSFAMFNGQSFALCGKTITSLRRNMVVPLLEVLTEIGIVCDYKISQGLLTLTWGKKSNRYYLFGGKDEGSAALIQGITLAGVLMDEVALMPRSFVEQALARCSVTGSKFWFNCNPGHPYHWFYTNWIKKSKEKNAVYLHFQLQDNPSLSPEIIKRYKSLYTGVFYERYVLGKWVSAHGAVYPMFSPESHVVDDLPLCDCYVVSCDYGTVNPASFGLWGIANGNWYRMKEYYHDSREKGVQRTDEEYADELCNLVGELQIQAVVVDPSAASFIQCLRRRGNFNVVPAKNEVLDGIRNVSGALATGKMKIHRSCKDTMREFSLYRWDLESNKDCPIKENDHAMDDIRYFVTYALGTQGHAFVAKSTQRRNAI